MAIVTLLAAGGTALVLRNHSSNRAAALAARHAQVDRTVNSLLAGIPQEGLDLGKRTAPFTVEIFLDLEDPTCRWWFREKLPVVISRFVRTGVLRLQYHAFKRNTYSPAVFVNQQTAALAAGAQNELWNFTGIFLYEQGGEFAHYANEAFLNDIARQIPGLSLSQWHTDRHTGRREEQTVSEDQAARALGLHVTPAFRIAKASKPMSILTGQYMVQYPEQHHPIALIEASDIASAIKRLDHKEPPSPTKRVIPEILSYRLE